MKQHIASVCILSLLLGACAHPSPESFKDDLARADQKCGAAHWDTLSAKIACFDGTEAPVVRKDIPFAATAFQTFSARRAEAAAQFDADTAAAKLAWDRFNNAVNQAMAVLAAHEPLYLDQTSVLRRELAAINFDAVCQQPKREDKMACFGAVGRPIWERDAPGTLAAFDQFQEARMALARQYDASGAGDLYAAAFVRYKQRTDAAGATFYADARQALQAVQAQAAEDKARAQERNAQSLKALGDFVGALAAVTIGAAVVVGEARTSAPASAYPPLSNSLHCQTNTFGTTTYTDCH